MAGKDIRAFMQSKLSGLKKTKRNFMFMKISGNVLKRKWSTRPKNTEF